MFLLDIPIEMLKIIIETTVMIATLDHAIMMRLVCKTFDREIMQALCNTKALEMPHSKVKIKGERIISECLISRTLADRACEHHLSQVIRETLDYILSEGPEDEARRVKYTKSLCMAAVRSHEFTRIYLHRILNTTTPAPRLECSVVGNAFAATIFLGLGELSHRLVRDGVEDECTYFGRPINIAASQGDLEMTRLLLERGYSLNARRSALAFAARSGRTAILQLVLDPKYNVDTPSDFDAWHWGIIEMATLRAAAGGHLDTMRFLMQRALSSGLLERRRRISTYHFDADKRPMFNVWQDTILRTAALHGQTSVARMALDNGANPSCFLYTPGPPFSPLDCAAINGHEEIVRLLLQRGASAKLQCRSHPLDYAIKGGWLRIAQILIDNGAEVNPKNLRKDSNLLLAAVKRGQVESLCFLLDRGVDLGPGCAIGKEAYQLAASRGYTSAMRILVEHGVAV